MALPPWPLLAAFLLASLVLAVTPGPAVFYIVTRTLAQGLRAGLASVAGVALGNLGNAIGAAIGLAALFAISSLAFTVVKYAGAAYLVYLGIKALTAAPGPQDQPLQGAPADLRKIFRDGLLVALLNPKTSLFFAAFLPQFMAPEGSAIFQSVTLGTVFVLLAAVTDSLYVIAAGALGPAFARVRGISAFGRYLTAGAFIGLGIFTALASHGGPKSKG
jgi:threonine/homoserine/homoserine lactone efflux protein